MNPLANLFPNRSLTLGLIESSPAAVVVANDSGTILIANGLAQNWFGYAHSEFIGLALNGLLPDIDRRDQIAHQAPDTSQRARDERHESPQKVRCKDGTEMLVNVTITTVKEKSQELIVANLIRTDDNQISRLRVESERMDAIGTTIRGLAHESRNALQRAVACLDLLELDLKDCERQMELSSKIRRSLTDLQSNYDEVRRFAQPITLNRHPNSLLRIALDTFEEMKSQEQFRSHELVLDDPCQIDDVACVDQTRMSEVFQHLFHNCFDQTRSFARISINIEPAWLATQPAVRATVHDDGDGFEERIIHRVMEPFFTTRQHGTGLGLSICHRIVDAHRGVIKVCNPPEGGAMVEMVLPRFVQPQISPLATPCDAE